MWEVCGQTKVKWRPNGSRVGFGCEGLAKVKEATTIWRSDFVLENLAGRAKQEVLGRGETSDVEKTFDIILWVFDDSLTLGQLKAKFYSYVQRPNEDILSCSLELHALYQRIVDRDLDSNRELKSALKERLVDAMRHGGLKRELRCLNIKSPDLSYFQLRDRAIQWQGTDSNTSRRVESTHPAAATTNNRSPTENCSTVKQEVGPDFTYSPGVKKSLALEPGTSKISIRTSIYFYPMSDGQVKNIQCKVIFP